MTISAAFRFTPGQVEKIAQLLKQSNPKFLAAVRSNWAKAAQEFIGFIVRTQMTGRPGLRRQSSILSKSWFDATKEVQGDVTSRIFTETKYARIHQYGGVVKIPPRTQVLEFRRSKRGDVRFAKKDASQKTTLSQKRFSQKASIGEHVIKIPKRLHVVEEFKTGKGLRLYVQAVKEALKEFK